MGSFSFWHWLLLVAFVAFFSFWHWLLLVVVMAFYRLARRA